MGLDEFSKLPLKRIGFSKNDGLNENLRKMSVINNGSLTWCRLPRKPSDEHFSEKGTKEIVR